MNDECILVTDIFLDKKININIKDVESYYKRFRSVYDLDYFVIKLKNSATFNIPLFDFYELKKCSDNLQHKLVELS